MGKADPQLEAIPQRESPRDLMTHLLINGNHPNTDQKDDVQDAKMEADESCQMMLNQIVPSEISLSALLNPEKPRGSEDAILRDAQLGQIIEKVSEEQHIFTQPTKQTEVTENQLNPEQKIAQEDSKREADESCLMMRNQIVSTGAPEIIASIALVKPETAIGVEDDMLRTAQIGQIVGKVPTCSIGLEDKNGKDQDHGFGDGFKLYNTVSHSGDTYDLHLDSEDAGLESDSDSNTDYHFDWVAKDDLSKKEFEDTVSNSGNAYDLHLDSEDAGLELDPNIVADDHFDSGAKDDLSRKESEDDLSKKESKDDHSGDTYDLHLDSEDAGLESDSDSNTDYHFDWVAKDDLSIKEFEDTVSNSGNAYDLHLDSEDAGLELDPNIVADDHFDSGAKDDLSRKESEDDLSKKESEDDLSKKESEDDAKSKEKEKDEVDDQFVLDGNDDDDDVFYIIHGGTAILCRTVRQRQRVEDDEVDGFGDGFKFYDLESEDELFEDQVFGDGFHFFYHFDAVYDADGFDWNQPEDDVIYLFDGDVAILDFVRHFDWDQPEDGDVYLFDGDLAILATVPPLNDASKKDKDEVDGFGDGFKFYDFEDEEIADGFQFYHFDFEDEEFGDGFQFYHFDFVYDADDFDWNQSEDDEVYVFDEDVAILDHVRHFNWDQPEDDDVYLFDGDLAILTTVPHLNQPEDDELIG